MCKGMQIRDWIGAKIRNEERVGVERGCGGGGEGGRVPWLSELARISESFDEEDRLPEEVRRLLASSGELRVELIADANEKAERAAEERIFQRRPAAPAEMRRLCLSINMRHETRRNRVLYPSVRVPSGSLGLRFSQPVHPIIYHGLSHTPFASAYVLHWFLDSSREKRTKG
ncbi:hypothetical protein HZH68_013327 [Vespula germanica]|uniref:Uncharacterized protein n=1 Tax=Vespula germanica TaxID=30212 RepID=A0A834MVN7_VESGE|nr:hypothetical protein HZH68_013327 [Vespula germanica]